MIRGHDCYNRGERVNATSLKLKEGDLLGVRASWGKPTGGSEAGGAGQCDWALCTC